MNPDTQNFIEILFLQRFCKIIIHELRFSTQIYLKSIHHHFHLRVSHVHKTVLLAANLAHGNSHCHCHADANRH